MTCRCTCKAYQGRCDCRFDGEAAGEQRTVLAIVAWLRQPIAGGISAPPLLLDVADEILQGQWRP